MSDETTLIQLIGDCNSPVFYKRAQAVEELTRRNLERIYALSELETVRKALSLCDEDNERLRAELAALQPLAEAANYVGLLWPLALEDDAVGDLIDEARKLQKRRAATQDAAETNRSL